MARPKSTSQIATKLLTVRLTPADYEQCRALAHARDLSISDLIRILLAREARAANQGRQVCLAPLARGQASEHRSDSEG